MQNIVFDDCKKEDKMFRRIVNPDRKLVLLLEQEFSRILDAIYSEIRPLGFYWTTDELLQEIRCDVGMSSIPNSVLWIHFDSQKGKTSEIDRIRSFIIYREVGDVLDITVVATDPEVKRQKYAFSLFEEIIRVEITENKALEANHRQVWLEVHERNFAAQDLYTKLGFKIVGQRAHYYRDGGMALLMSR